MHFLSLKNLSYLQAIAKHQNFNKAAKHCFVSQATLSVGIKKLEDEIGSPLVERDSKLSYLTPIGKKINSLANEMLVLNQDILHMTKANNRLSLQIGVIPTIAPAVISELVTFANESNLDFYIQEKQSHNLLESLSQGELDMLIFAKPFPIPSQFVVHHIGYDPMYLVGKKGGKYSLGKEFDDNSLLNLEKGHCLRDQTLNACELHNSTAHNEFVANSIQTLLAMIKIDLGVGIITKLIADSSDLTGLQLETNVLHGLHREIVLITRKNFVYQEERDKIVKTVQHIMQAKR